MNTPSALHNSRRSQKLNAALLAAMLTAGGASTSVAAEFTQQAADSSNTSSFTSPLTGAAGGWTDGTLTNQAASSGNNYTTYTTLRTGLSGDQTFAGDSLTIGSTGEFAFKSSNNVTFTATVNNLIVDGGKITEGASGGNLTWTLGGNMTVNTSANIRAYSGGSTQHHVLDITANISGSGIINLYDNEAASANSSRGTIQLSAANAFTGTINVLTNPRSSTLGALRLNNLDAVKYATVNASDTSSTQQSITFGAGAGTYNIGALSGTVATGDIAVASGYNLSVGGNNASTSFAGYISGAGSLTKVGTGTMTLTGVNTFTGGTTITGGTLEIGASEVLANAGAVVLNGGTLAVGASFAETVATLDLDAASAITLGSGSSLVFSDSSGLDWGSFGLSITGSFVDGSSIRFGTDANGLTSSQLSLISINGLGATIDSSGFLVASAVPEPASFAMLAGLAGVAFAATRRRRQAC